MAAKVSSGRALHPIHELGIYVVVTAYPNKLHVGEVSGGKTRWLFKENVNTNDARVDGHDVLLGPALTKKAADG